MQLTTLCEPYAERLVQKCLCSFVHSLSEGIKLQLILKSSTMKLESHGLGTGTSLSLPVFTIAND